MANVDAPFGFRPVGNLDGSPYNGGTIRCVIPSGDGTATFIGDPVKLSGTGVLTDEGTYPTVIQATAAAEVFGVVTSFDPNRDDLANTYRKASTERLCQVVPALDNLFAIQADEDVEIADLGQAGDFTVVAGNTTTGVSNIELDSSDITTGSNCIILGVLNAPDNDLASDNPVVIVRINESSLRGDGTAV